MAQITHDILVQTKLVSILSPTYPLVQVYEDSIPANLTNQTMSVLMRVISPSFDDETYMKVITWQVTIVSSSRSTSKTACGLVWEALKDASFGSGDTGTDGKKVLITATTMPSYDGVDETGNSMYSVLLQLTARH